MEQDKYHFSMPEILVRTIFVQAKQLLNKAI